jgi:hypothetical protein
MEMTQPAYPVVMMSCKDGTNKEVFLESVQSLTQSIMGKSLVALRYKYSDHEKITRWLFEHASITSVENLSYDDDGMMTLRVPIDEVIHQKYLKVFEPEKFEGER